MRQLDSTIFSGSKTHSEALKWPQKSDSMRRRLFKLKGGKSATVKELLKWFG